MKKRIVFRFGAIAVSCLLAWSTTFLLSAAAQETRSTILGTVKDASGAVVPGAGIDIANAETNEKKQLRLKLAAMTANTIRSGMELMGIRVPERM